MFAIFYTKRHDRVLTPLFATGQPQAPPVIAAALRTTDRHIDNRLADARLPTAGAIELREFSAGSDLVAAYSRRRAALAATFSDGQWAAHRALAADVSKDGLSGLLM